MAKTTLDGPKRYQLCTLLKRKWGEITSVPQSFEDCAKNLSIELGFTVTKNNVKSAVSVLGKIWPHGRGPIKEKTNNKDIIIKQLRALIKELGATEIEEFKTL